MKKTVICIIIPTLLFVSCQGDPMPGPRETVVNIDASLVEADLATKMPITGTSFPDYYLGSNAYSGMGTYGIFVCKHGTTDRANAHKTNSYNLRALYTSGRWYYFYVSSLSDGQVSSVGTNNLTLTPRDNSEETADLYAYAPYIYGAYSAGPTAIPYSIARASRDQIDLMYAEENKATFDDETDDQDGNENLNPLSETPLNATFIFKHAFSLLAFRFKLRNDASVEGALGTGTNYDMTDITVTLNPHPTNPKAKLYRSGTFNAITGSFNNGGAEATSLSIATFESGSYDHFIISSASSYATAYIMLVPTDVSDNELVFTFTVNGHTLQPFYLQASQLTRYENNTPVPGSAGKLEGGYKYTFNFTLDNYLYFDGFSVGEWTTPTDPLGEQPI